MTATRPPVATVVLLGSLLDPRSVGVGGACADVSGALRLAADLLTRVGAVASTYADEALAREAEYPTGLPTAPVGVALPHADRGVIRPAISVLTLAEPVIFREMGTGENWIPVRMIIMLALPAGDAHVQAVASLAELLQRPEFVAEAVGAATAEALYATFMDWTSRPIGKE
jgi:PTS system galactitol-specific IIA component